MAARGNQVRGLAARSDHLDGDMIHSDLSGMVSGDTHATQSMVDLFIMLFNKIEAHEIEVENTAQIILESNQRLTALETELKYVKNENEMLRHQLAITEDATHTMYLRLEGLSEGLNNNLPLNVANCLSKTGVSCTVNDLDHVKRIGKFKEGQIRPILIRFMKEGKRNTILYNRANLNKNKLRDDPLMWINDDVSEDTRRKRKAVRDIATLAKRKGIPGLKVHGDGLIYNNCKYKHEDLDLLPPDISLSQAKSREEESGIYFQGEASPYSNFYNARFSDEQGQVFENVEQAYQYKKALFHGKLLIADKIGSTRNPYEIKRLAKQLPSNKDWLKEERSIMKGLVRNKFRQNRHLENMLIQSGDMQFHESTSDPKWGTGAELSSKALLNGEWTGQDVLGQVIEEVRNELIGNSKSITPNQCATAVQDNRAADDLDNLTPMGEDQDTELDNELSQTTADPTNHSEGVTQSTTQTPHVTPRHQPQPEKRNKSTSSSQPPPPAQTPSASTSPRIKSSSVSSSQPGSPASTQEIIHDLTRRTKRTAPTPPATSDKNTSNMPKLRGNRSTRAKPAASKGKS